MKIAYDPAKNLANREKHGLDFERVALLDWDNAIIRVDKRKDYGESRYVALAKGPDGLCQVAFTLREDTLRVISFRRAHERERKKYEQI